MADVTLWSALGGALGAAVGVAAELIAVHATSLDDSSHFNPQMVTYSMRGHGWDTIDSSLQKFERMPPG